MGQADMFRLAALDVVDRLQVPLLAALRAALASHLSDQVPFAALRHLSVRALSG